MTFSLPILSERVFVKNRGQISFLSFFNNTLCLHSLFLTLILYYRDK